MLKRHINMRKQDGAVSLGVVIIIGAVLGAVWLSLRLIPHYIDFETMKSVMEDLPGPQVHEMDKRTIRDSLEKRFKINNLRSFKVRDVVKIERTSKSTVIDVAYEVREPLMFNIDLVLSFEDQYTYQ